MLVLDLDHLFAYSHCHFISQLHQAVLEMIVELVIVMRLHKLRAIRTAVGIGNFF